VTSHFDNSAGGLQAATKGQGQEMASDWWRGAVIYQVYPRSFQDSDGDGIGDLPGLTRRLSHIADLGADAIWLSPVFRSPMADMGYDVSDYTDIDPLFGTLADFDTMLAAAHRLGLKVIIDQVISHSAAAHPFFRESRASRDNPRADWYVWADPRPDGGPPNNWLSVFGGPAWEWDSRRRQYYLHNFLPSQPDFNYHNQSVQDWALSVLKFWLDRGVDGFRLDTVNYYFHDKRLRRNPPALRPDTRPPANPLEMQDQRYSKNRPENLAFLERLRALLDGYDGRAMVGEVGDSGDTAIRLMAAYTGPRRLHMAYSFELLGPAFTPAHFRSRIEAFFRGAPGGWPCWAFSNHDVIRHATRWADHGPDGDAVARLAAAMLLSFPGSVCLYQGEELGQTETDILFDELTDPPGIAFWPDYKGRDGCRTPMVWDGSPNGGFTGGRPWLPVKPPQAARHAAGQAGAAGSVLETYRALLTFRRTQPALRHGTVTFHDAPGPVLAFTRGTGDGALLCLFNLSPGPVTLTVHGAGKVQGPERHLSRRGSQVALGPCGYGFLTAPGAVSVGGL
jgi:alpha-glucosidase